MAIIGLKLFIPGKSCDFATFGAHSIAGTSCFGVHENTVCEFTLFQGSPQYYKHMNIIVLSIELLLEQAFIRAADVTFSD